MIAWFVSWQPHRLDQSFLNDTPPPEGDPLNYFIYPSTEANGQPVKNLQKGFAFRDIPGSQQAPQVREWRGLSR